MARPLSKLEATSPWPERLTWLAFLLALGLVVARAAMQQTLRDSFHASPGGTPSPRAPGPAAGVGLDLLCCLPALLILARRVIDKSYILRPIWSFIPLAAVSVWMCLSTVWAADKFAAAVSASHWVAATAILWAAAQLVRSWLRLRLVAVMCFSILPVYAIEGVIYKLQELPMMRKYFDENKNALLAEQNLTPGTFQAEFFENKLKQGEMMGFFHSSNTFGAAISLLLVLGIGIAIQQCVDRDGIKWGLPTATTAMAAGLVILVLTLSRGAFATLGIALILFLLIWEFRARLANQSRRYFVVGVALVIFMMIAVIGHGLFHGSLPTRTLTFRWHYWVGSARLFQHHPLLGVGWENFGANYLAYRLPQAPEEVKDPHNFLVRFFAELGLIGGILLIAWLLRLWWELTRPITPAAPAPIVSRHAPPATLGVVKFAAAVAGLATLIYLTIGADWVRNQVENFLLNWLLFCAAIILTASLLGLRSLDVQTADDRPAHWMLYGMIVAVGGMLVHNLIDFSLFEAGPMFLFVLLAGSALGARQPSVAGKRRRTAAVAVAFAAALVLFMGAALFFWGPMAAAQRYADQADELIWRGKLTDGVPDNPSLLGRQAMEAVGLLIQAADLQPLNGEFPLRAATYAAQTLRLLQASRASSPDVEALSSSLVTLARETVDRAVRANPLSGEARALRGRMILGSSHPDTAAARRDLLDAIESDPNNVDRRLEAADLLASSSTPEDRAFAQHQYEEALRFDSLLPTDEKKRLPASRIAEVRKKVADLAAPR